MPHDGPGDHFDRHYAAIRDRNIILRSELAVIGDSLRAMENRMATFRLGLRILTAQHRLALRPSDGGSQFNSLARVRPSLRAIPDIEGRVRLARGFARG